MKTKVKLALFAYAVFCAFFGFSKEAYGEAETGGQSISSRNNTPQTFFLRRFFGEREPYKFFLFGDVIYKVNTPHPDENVMSFRIDADFLEIGESLLKVQEDWPSKSYLFTAYGKMTVGDWEKILKSKTVNTDWYPYPPCSSRGEKYTVIYYNNELIQVDNATGEAVKRIPLEDPGFRRNYCFEDGYILFSSLWNYGDEINTPDRLFFRMYDENLDYIDLGENDLLHNRDYGYPLASIHPVTEKNKAGISIEYGTWALQTRAYVTSYLFDFESRKVIRTMPAVTQLYSELLKNQYEDLHLFVYPTALAWDIHPWEVGSYGIFPWTYPVQNPDLFREAVGLEKLGNVPLPVKKEQGAFSFDTYYYFSFLSPSPVFFFSYDRDTFTQDCTKSKYFGTELHKAFTDVLWKTTVSAPSFLTEGAVEYRAENMRGFSGSPWAVKSADMAEAEVRIEADRPISWLVFGNGFYRTARPELYTKNSRPKEIVITYGDTSAAESVRETREHHVILADTFEMQLVPLLYEGKQVTVKIVSVYPGTDYDDICLNYIGALGNPLLIDSRKWER